MATNTVPAMPSLSSMSADLIAPGAGPISSKADVGARSRYCTQLHASRVAGFPVPDSMLGEAVCIVNRAASLLNGSADTGESVCAKVDQLTADIAVVKSMLTGIKAGQDNVPHRSANAMSRMLEHPLEPLKAEAGEQVGEYPPADLFPASLGQIATLGHAQLNNLEQFYGRAFAGGSLAARQSKFTSFIGAH